MYHLAIKPISRSTGRSATAAAAYRAGSLVIDERTGEVHDYTRKGDIEHSEILVPAGSPAWATERVALWNAAEAAEKRKDARVARDYEVAIPKELTREQGIALVRDFAQRLVDAYGVAVDFNVHRDELRGWDGSEKGWQGYHAHLLTSTRRLGRDGFGEKTFIELSDTKRKSLGLSDGAAEIARVREWWEIDANRHLEQAGQAKRIDRRSLEAQGVDREPMVHLGPAVTLLERDGVPSRLGNLNRQIVAQAKTRLAEQQDASELDVVLDKIRARQAERQAQREEAEAKARQAEELVKPVKPATQAKEPKEALSPVDASQGSSAAAEALRQLVLERLVRQRDKRVRWVLAQAEQRETRRQKAHQVLLRAAPVAPQGVMAVFQQRGHEQALAAWNAAKEAAAKLAEQARQLVRRLRELVAPERILAWSRMKVEERSAKAGAAAVVRNRLEERPREPAAMQPSSAALAPESARAGRMPTEAAKPVKAETPHYAKLSLEDRVFVVKEIVERLKAERLQRLSSVEQKTMKRQKRREGYVPRLARLRPVAPTGMFAGFKQKGYEEESRRWWERTLYVNRLVEQSVALNNRIETDRLRVTDWALKVVKRADPGLYQSVETYFGEQRSKRFEQQMREMEISRSRDRGRDGPQR